MIKMCMIGASGRMGREIMQLINNDENTVLSGAVERTGSEYLGSAAVSLIGTGRDDGPKISDSVLESGKDADVLIDFTGAAATMANLQYYKQLKKALIIGSTGLSSDDLDKIYALGKDMPVLWASNMSVGVNVLAKLTELAAKVLDDQFDIEIFESHHRYKQDAPSGTAITLGEAAAKGRGLDFSKAAVYSREGITGERQKDQIGFQVLRGGDIVGEHTVFFCADGERIEITHRATSRSILAKGAMRAAKWIAGKPAGVYTINDALGLN